ncbi:radical SAM protein [Streptosporangium sp. NPDC006007]|uniref:radical SAM protein n=1 Tax=Streptosporangium sp. NPDC006007 TaxID=3154575 RepID=UPI0033B6B7E1
MTAQIDKFIWDLTYACPLRCIHCYSESGRRAARMLSRDDAMRVVDVVCDARPQWMSISGGEPLLAPWWREAVRRLHDAGIAVTMFTSGWFVDEQTAEGLATSVTTVAVSVDGSDARIHDAVRGRNGAFVKAMTALELLNRVKEQRAADGEFCCSLGIDYTVTRSGMRDLEDFVEAMTTRFPSVDFIRFGAVIPSGLAAEEEFERDELLTYDQLVELTDSQRQLAAHVRSAAEVSVTDVRYFLPGSSASGAGEAIASIEADGQMRAFPIYEAKVGNVLEEPIDVLWARVLAWRQEPFVVEQLRSIRTVADWARVARALDRRYGSPDDQARIARRGRS